MQPLMTMFSGDEEAKSRSRKRDGDEYLTDQLRTQCNHRSFPWSNFVAAAPAVIQALRSSFAWNQLTSPQGTSDPSTRLMALDIRFDQLKRSRR